MRTRTREVENLETVKYVRTIGEVNRDYDLSLTWQSLYPKLLSEVTTDEIHPKYPYEGGPFSSQKAQYEFSFGTAKSGQDYTGLTGKPVKVYKQGQVALKAPGGSFELPESTVSDAEDQGPSAWNKYKPAKPDVSLSVFVAELRDLPGLLFKRLNSFRNLGNNYLAAQFGWKPFLMDLRDTYQSVIEVDRRIAQLRRDNGRYIKRGGTLINNQDIITESYTDSHTALVIGVPIDSISYVDTIETVEKCWFSARFRYYIPGLNDPKWGRLRAIQELYDLKITPEQIYQLMPWSWLVDWFSNTGDIVSNLMSQVDDNLTAKYAYVMYHRKTTAERTAVSKHSLVTGKAPDLSYGFTTAVLKAKYTQDAKSRCVASPFGFNVKFDGLSSYQTSILTALGLSRLRF